ncbi:MAG: hypothetical protein RMJ56_17825 [Gemmataceae bacterium]|nr:hypothetical protein [Gemmata sp.]MDW8199458.1 hypothetical protein [Gemmataceae bacterium]
MNHTYTSPASATSAPVISVSRGLAAVWLVGTVAALAFVAFLGTNAPYADEWEFVPVLVGEEPVGPWLWQLHNEHRMVLPRLVYWALFQLTHDFRTGMFLQVVVLAGLAWYLMRLAATLRGRPDWSDAFFPISMLHIGHWENFVMGYQICFVFFTLLVMGLVVVALHIRPATAFRSGGRAAGLLLLLALTGSFGLAVVPPVALWLAIVAGGIWYRGQRAQAVGLLLLTLLPVIYLANYLHDYQKPAHHPELSTDPFTVLRVAGETLAVAFGIGLAPVWWWVAPTLGLLGLATLVQLVRQRWPLADERLAVMGLVAVAAGVAGVALAIGIGRGGWGAGMGLWSRYSLLMWPLVAMAYLVWVRQGAKWVPIGLCVMAALAFPGNVGFGIGQGAACHATYSAIAADAAAGLSAEAITQRNFAHSHQTGYDDWAHRAIPLLRAARIGIFAGN